MFQALATHRLEPAAQIGRCQPGLAADDDQVAGKAAVDHRRGREGPGAPAMVGPQQVERRQGRDELGGRRQHEVPFGIQCGKCCTRRAVDLFGVEAEALQRQARVVDREREPRRQGGRGAGECTPPQGCDGQGKA
jgi:hypothetical protein